MLLGLNPQTGLGVNLGATVGNFNSFIALPAGWVLETPLVPPGGCLLTPTRLANEGNGRYRLSVISRSSAGPCAWLKGEYLFSVRIQNIGGFNGSVIDRLTIQ
jgi:hypothetical protein